MLFVRYQPGTIRTSMCVTWKTDATGDPAFCQTHGGDVLPDKDAFVDLAPSLAGPDNAAGDESFRRATQDLSPRRQRNW